MRGGAERKAISLALQGGGSHGALTWGVLDRLLEEPDRLEVTAMSGTSAGAMNAVVILDGAMRGGIDGAREALEQFWRSVGEAALFSPIQRTLWDRMTNTYSLANSPSYVFADNLSRVFSPYEWNPLNLNPLRDLLARTVDFDRVNACKDFNVYVTATNVRTGTSRIFTQPELSVDVIMASACLPFAFQAVEIDGEAYWDGGFIGNPALYPLVEDPRSRDMVVVQINPLRREAIPRSGPDILHRLYEIAFNASLVKELRAIELLHEMIEEENLELENYRNMRIHLIHEHDDLKHLDASAQANAEWDYLLHLKQIGRRWAETFLARDFATVGQHSTFNIREMFPDSFRPVQHAPKA